MDNRENIAIHENKKAHFGYILILVILLCSTLYIVLRGQNPQEIYTIVKTLDKISIILGLLAAIIFICCEALVLKILLGILGEKKTYLQFLKYSFVGFYFSSITPSASGGQPMQVYYMKKDGVNISKSSLSILVTVGIYQITMVSYGIISLILNHSLIKEVIDKIYPLIVFGVFTNILVIGFILGSIFFPDIIYRLAYFIIKILHRINIIGDMEKAQINIQNQVEEYREGAALIYSNRKSIVMIFLITFIQLTSMYSVPFFVYRGFGLYEFSIFKVVALQSILNIAVSSLPLPGAVGASEGTFMILFKVLFPRSILAAAMLVSRGISYYTLLIISGLVLIFVQLFPKAKDYSI